MTSPSLSPVLRSPSATANVPARIAVRVDQVIDETDDIRVFHISRVDGTPFDAYEAGAHVDVILPDAPVRQYSLCGQPANRQTLCFAVKREAHSRGGSRAIHERLTVGSKIDVSVPRNLFRLSDGAREHVLIAAGIGITPLLSMAYHLLALPDSTFTLHYFVRSTAQAAFVPLLTSEPFARHVVMHAGVAPEALDDELAKIFQRCGSDAHAYTCGPGAFMDHVMVVGERTHPADNLHLERFSAEPAPMVADTPAPGAFDVVLANSGQRVTVSAGTTIVDALAGIGIEIDTSCGEGICGTCIVDVVDGEPDHRDHCLSKAERAANKTICCCVSRAKSAVITLDI
ncbi:PDR/VanB family oxidoreductase [Robbsia andropogonis]|uniref:PDR/VanB family oxidoreductase n=1 Tax=Robbsia andropogonis TaxID=28092 RepID=UPI0004AD32D5|nr:PDR/VanB family oxidoreductase [Robbsia andropogonis]